MGDLLCSTKRIRATVSSAQTEQKLFTVSDTGKHAVGMNERNENMFILSSQEEEETRLRPRGSVLQQEAAQFIYQGSLIFHTFTPYPYQYGV